jgi:hypothetical protein
MAGRGDPRKASDMVRRSASPPASWGGGERRVVALKPMGPSIIIGFPEVTPSAGEQANPRHGFVSRPGGAFKFQAVRQMPTQAPKNPYQVPGSRVSLRTHARSAVREAQRGRLTRLLPRAGIADVGTLELGQHAPHVFLSCCHAFSVSERSSRGQVEGRNLSRC